MLQTGVLGGAERDRTAGLLVANEALSQLSYSPTLSDFYILPAIPGSDIAGFLDLSFLRRSSCPFQGSSGRQPLPDGALSDERALQAGSIWLRFPAGPATASKTLDFPGAVSSRIENIVEEHMKQDIQQEERRNVPLSTAALAHVDDRTRG